MYRLYMLTSQSEYNNNNWKSPSKELELMSLRCSNCFMVSDLDVVSTLSYYQNDDDTFSYTWPCKICLKSFDNTQIEAKLIQYLENIFYAYQAQDYICPICKSVKNIYRRSNCTCGKKFNNRLSTSYWE